MPEPLAHLPLFPAKALLIDLDNCPQQLDSLPELIQEYERVVACHGREPKVNLSLVTQLAQAVQDGKLEIVGMSTRTKNAADFGLTFLAGRLAAEMPADT